MSSQHSDRSRLLHIKDAIDAIWEYVEDGPRDNKTRDATIRQLEIIGEAARHISAPTKLQYSQLAWRDIVNMRHQLSHGYFQVDIQEVWNTVDNDLQPLQDVILTMLDDKNIL